MFDKLKKLLEGGVAQVNPFDNGKTFQSVVNNRTPQQQNAVQQQQQQARVFNPARPQQAPQQNFTDKLRDILDANSQADKFRRAQMGQATSYQEQQAKAPNVYNQVAGAAEKFSRYHPLLNPMAGLNLANDASNAKLPGIGVSTQDVARQIPQATGQVAKGSVDVAKGFVANPMRVGKMIAYPIIEAEMSGKLNRGEMTYDSYKSIVDQAAKEAGIGLNDSSGTVLRKTGGAVFGTAGDILTAGTMSPKMAGGLVTGKLGKATEVSVPLINKVAGGIGTGAALGAANTLQRDQVTPESVATDVVGGAAIGGAFPVALAGGGKVIGALGRQFRKPRSVAEIAQEVAARQPAIANNAPRTRVTPDGTILPPRPASEIAAELAASKARAADPNVQAKMASIKAAGQPSTPVKKINMTPDDQRILADFNDIANGFFKPDAKLQRKIEYDATQIAEKYNIPLRSTPQEMAEEFDNVLQRGVTKPEFAPKPQQYNQLAPKPSKQDPLEALKAEARKYKSADEYRKNLIYNDDIIIHQTGKKTADKIRAEGFKAGKETGLGEKRGEVYGMSAWDWNKHGKFSKDTYARDGSGVAEVAIDTRGLKIADRTKQKFTDEEYVKGIHKQIPKGYDGVRVGYGNGVNEVLLKPEVANARRFSIDDLYNQAVGSKATKPPKAYYQNVPKSYTQREIPASNQRTIDSYSTPKPVTEYKVGEKVSNATAQGGTVDGTIVKTPDFSKDLRYKGNNFEVKLSDGTTVKTDGAGFDNPTTPPKSYTEGKADPNRNWKLSNQVDDGYRTFDDAKKAANAKMNEFRSNNNGKPFTKAQQKELEPYMKAMEDGLNKAKQANAELNPTTQVTPKPTPSKSYTEPKATIQEPVFKPGQTVRSAERDNVGKIIGKQNADGTYNVRFVNKAEGTKATIRLKQEEIVGGGAPITTQATPGEIKISSAIESNKPSVKTRTQEVREQLVSRFSPVEDLVSKIEKETGTPLRPSKNPLSYIRQYLGGGGIANAKIDNELAPIIKQTKEFDGLREYLVAKRMNELADRGMSKRADDVLEGINQKYGAEVANFEKVAKELYAYQNRQLDELVDVGVLTREAADNIRAKNQYYVPFNRVMPELEDFAGTAPANAIGRNGNPIKAIHGSDKDIIDPIESMIRNTYDIQATVQKQKVMRSLYELAPDEFRIPAKDSMNKNRVGMFLDGKKTMLETSEPLARALNSMAEEQMNYAVRVMSIPAKMLRSGATSLNVAFALPNIVRDQLSAAVNSKYGGIPIYDFISGLASVISKDDSYKKWIMSGADQASFFAQDRTTLQRGVKDITGGVAYKAGKYVKSPLELFRVLGEFSEKGSRVGVYKRAEKGAMKEWGNMADATLAAAKESREATIDFARRGSKMKAANALIPFLNARLQGTLKLANSFRERPVQTGAVGMAIAGLPAAALYLHNSQYPEYNEIPDYVRRENFIIMTGNKETPFIKIPKGEVGKIFGNPVESFLAQMSSEDPEWKSTVGTLVDSFLPVGSVEDPGKFVTDLMPTAASVPLQMTANFDTFRGMPIVSQWQKDLPPEQQFSNYNTETGKKIGAALGVSPAMLEFGIGGITGGLGRQALQLGDIATGNKVPTQDLPVISRFAGEQKDLSKSAGEVYDQLDKDKQKTARDNYKLKQAIKSGDLSGIEGMDKTKANRLVRSVKEDEIKKTLNPTEKALWGMSKEDLESYEGKYGKEASKVLELKNSLNTSSKEAKTNKEKYEQALEKFNDPDNGYSKVEKVKKTEELKRLTVQKDYDEDTTMLHGMSKEDVWGFLSTYEDGKAMADKLLALDDALTAAGVQDKNKFRDKYGNIAIKPKEKSSGKGGSKAKTVKGQAEAVSSERKLRALLANTNNKTSYRKPATQSAKIGLKKFAVKSAGITSRKGA